MSRRPHRISGESSTPLAPSLSRLPHRSFTRRLHLSVTRGTRVLSHPPCLSLRVPLRYRRRVNDPCGGVERLGVRGVDDLPEALWGRHLFWTHPSTPRREPFHVLPHPSSLHTQTLTYTHTYIGTGMSGRT